MTRDDWFACTDPPLLLGFLRADGRADERRLRLLACACVRSGAWPLLADVRCRQAIEAREGHADGLIGDAELKATQTEAWRALIDAVDAGSPAVDAVRSAAEAVGQRSPSPVARARASGDPWRWLTDADRRWADETERWAERVLELAARAAAAWTAAVATDEALRAALGAERATQCGLICCVFGDPFAPPPVLDPAWLSWDGGVVRRLAESIRQEEAFDRLPVLADALVDASCDDAGLLGHLRGPGPHIRWCFALGRILGPP